MMTTLAKSNNKGNDAMEIERCGGDWGSGDGSGGSLATFLTLIWNILPMFCSCFATLLYMTLCRFVNLNYNKFAFFAFLAQP